MTSCNYLVLFPLVSQIILDEKMCYGCSKDWNILEHSLWFGVYLKAMEQGQPSL